MTQLNIDDFRLTPEKIIALRKKFKDLTPSNLNWQINLAATDKAIEKVALDIPVNCYLVHDEENKEHLCIDRDWIKALKDMVKK